MNVYSKSVVRNTKRKTGTVRSAPNSDKLKSTVEHIEESELLFETSNTSISQSDRLGKFILTLQSNLIIFRACELISFRKKIHNIDLGRLLSSDSPDIEIINMPHCDRLFVFTIHEILELKELFAGAFAMIELNSLIHKEIIRKGIFS